MTTIVIEGNSPQAKKFVAHARTLPFVKVKRSRRMVEPEFDLRKSLESAFADVRLMLDGKKKEKSLDEFLEELRKEREDELQNSND